MTWDTDTAIGLPTNHEAGIWSVPEDIWALAFKTAKGWAHDDTCEQELTADIARALQAERKRATEASEAALNKAIKALEFWEHAFDTGRSEPLFVARDNSRNTREDILAPTGE